MLQYSCLTAFGSCAEACPGQVHQARYTGTLKTYCCLCRGVLNVVHGSRPAVTGILDHPDIKAVSFVGSDQAGRFIYERGCANGKRVQASSGRARAALPRSLAERRACDCHT